MLVSGVFLMSMEPLGALFQPVGRKRLSPSVEQQVKDSLSSAPSDSYSRSGLSAIIPMRLIPDEKRFAGLAMGGAPAWAVRLKKIETLTDALINNLHDCWVTLAYQHRQQPELFAGAWREQLDELELDVVNELIRRHNRYFPVEANLPMSPRTGDYVAWGGRDWRCSPLTSEWAEQEFPPDFDAAIAAYRASP
ncbi:MAG TPA: hypothetical protein VHX16_15620 [Chloroflexota bacterium]|nr:hypothetical protein [Chloroflexota bacterium]